MRQAPDVRPYDLAVIIRGLGVGGTERHTAELLNYLAGSGFRVVLLQCGFDLRSIGLREVPGKLDVVSVDLPMRNLSRRDLQRWSRVLGHYRADRVLLIKPGYDVAELSLLRLIRKWTANVAHFEHSLPPKLGRRSSRLHFGFVPGVGLWWYKELYRRWRMSRLVDLVLVDSEAARLELVENVLLPADKVVACPNGIDVTRWLPDESKARAFRDRYGIPQDDYLFGIAGRAAPEKGIDLAIRAFDRLRKSRGGISLCVVGEGPLRRDLQRFAEELGLKDLARFTGYVDDISAAYSAFDTVLLPSKVESCPLVLLEAMACGCRVIASPVGGVPEILGDAVCGDLVPSREPGDWTGALERHLQTPPDHRPGLARRVREFVVATHDQRRQFQLVAGLLRAPARGAIQRFTRPTDSARLVTQRAESR
jgi:glycosyltransferase involved in cell wall biosynthesis